MQLALLLLTAMGALVAIWAYSRHYLRSFPVSFCTLLGRCFEFLHWPHRVRKMQVALAAAEESAFESNQPMRRYKTKRTTSSAQPALTATHAHPARTHVACTALQLNHTRATSNE